MMLMARRKGRSPGVAARRGCSVGGVECLATPRRELDSHSLNRATYTVAWKFRRSDKLAHQEKSCRSGAMRAHQPAPIEKDSNRRIRWRAIRLELRGNFA
jgi:hypothetical protein